MNFSLPPEVTFKKEQLTGCIAYRFRHKILGDLGRILLHHLPGGKCHIASEVAGDSCDPMTETRLEIFRPISEQIIQALEFAFGAGEPGNFSPPLFSPSQSQEIVESKAMPCDQCGAYVALLIYANGATESGELEDYARKMVPQYQKMNVPTWIIGEAIGIASDETPCKTLKVWPNREPIQEITPNDFNAGLDKLMARHCQ